MSYLTLLITVPLTVLTILLVVSNPQSVSFFLFPKGAALHVPLYMIGVPLLIGGFFLGAFFVFLHHQKTIFRYWREKKRAATLEKERDALHLKVETLVETDQPRLNKNTP